MNGTHPPTILWFRRDLRLADHPGWAAALAGGGPVIPVFILDPVLERSLGAAPAWRLGEGLASLDTELRRAGSRLVLRRGEALGVLRALAAETGAGQVIWSRLYDPEAKARDTAIKAALTAVGIAATSVNASLLFDPWTVTTSKGDPYRVYTPFWRAVRGREVPGLAPAPADLAAPAAWPASDRLEDWRLGARMRRGAAVVARHAGVGEARAQDRLARFLEERIRRYQTDRDRLDLEATSGLSENLAWGEIGPQRLWHAGLAAMEADPACAAGAEQFLKELVWREFAYHLLYHFPHMADRNWREEWDGFPWRNDNADAERWRHGMTGFEVIDAAMRQLWVTGTMHNRARMLVASFLTKHLLTDWRVGAAWFRDCLIDWDPASNALGWQWVAGSGPDAAPYFRIFNPQTQAAKFDPDGRYRGRFLAEGRTRPHLDALSFFDAVPAGWGVSADRKYPAPMIDLAAGRERALAAYKAL